MERTRRFWVVFAVAGGSAIVAVLFSNQLLFGIPIGVGTWLLAHQVAVVRSTQQIRSVEADIIDQSLVDERIQTGDSTTLRVQFADENRTMAELEALVELLVPPELLVDSEHPRRHLTDDTMEFEISLRAPTAGSFKIGTPRIQFLSSYGLFRGTLRAGNTCSLVVDPRVPESIQLDLDEQQSEAAGQQDGSTDSTTAARPMAVGPTHLFLDRRASMADGRLGETKLDYAREIGLAFMTRAADTRESIRLSLIGHDQVSRGSSTSTESEQYGGVRRQLHDLTPESDTARLGETNRDVDRDRRGGNNSLSVRRDAAQRVTAPDRDDILEQTLAPYFETTAMYHERLSNEPLFSSVTVAIEEDGTDSWFVIITDDTNRGELLGTVQLASIHDAKLSFFVFPSAFFVDTSLTEVDGLTEAYHEFQTLISELNETDGVNAFEAGPHTQPSVPDAHPTRRAES